MAEEHKPPFEEDGAPAAAAPRPARPQTLNLSLWLRQRGSLQAAFTGGLQGQYTELYLPAVKM